jgi:hypothetical protein
MSGLPTETSPARSGPEPPGPVRALVELFAMCGFASTQPLLDVFGRSVEQFAVSGASAAQIVLFALGLTFLPALGLWAAELAVGLFGERPRHVLHQVWIALLATVFVVQAARPLATGLLLLAVALVAAGLAVLAYRRLVVVRMWLTFAALAPAGFLLLFLFASPTARLLRDDTAAASVAVGAPAPVVMLVLDELPLASLIDEQGDIDADLYPSFASLASDAHWFRNATTVTSTTWHALPSLVTGRMPVDGTGPVASQHPDNLFTLLGDSYEMNVTETISRLCPASVCAPTAASSDVWRSLVRDAERILRSRLSLSRTAEDPVAGFAEVTGAQDPSEPLFRNLEIPQPDRFDQLLDGLSDAPRALHYLHILLPHVPYQHTPTGRLYDGPNPDFGRLAELDTWDEQAWPPVVGRQRHILQTIYVDTLLGVLLDELKASGLYDQALLVVTADHGISFEPGGPIRSVEGQALTAASTPDVLWVPLFVKEPGQRTGTVSDANVLSIDVLPTIADVLDIELPWEVDGRSALGPPRAETTKPFFPNDLTPFGVSVLDRVTVDATTAWRAVLQRSLGRFLPGPDDRQRLWRVGPSPELVGQRVEEIPPGTLEALDAVIIDGPSDEASSGRAQVLVRAHSDQLVDADEVAVSLDGVVAATGVAFRFDDRIEVAMVVDEALIAGGGSTVAVHRIR